jgi:phosphatidylserine/phosphatidylglycerophosphate/cardiolipin synthase-like enzyme
MVVTLTGCGFSTPSNVLLSPSLLTPTNSTLTPLPNLPAWLDIYFTDPNPPDNLGHGIDQYVVQALESATKTIDVASFDLNLPSVINALVSARQRGINVRVVYDGINGNLELENTATNDQPFDTLQILEAAKISIPKGTSVDGGRLNGLMHDKFIIIDNQVLFMGSWNLSYNDTYRNNNNLLKITDPHLIANYQAKFDELFMDKLFGTNAQVKVPYPFLTIEGTQVENYFAPEDHVMTKIINEVKGATKSVHFMAYTYTSYNLASAMIGRSKAGLEVQGVIEDRNAMEGSFVDLFCAGIPIKTDGNSYNMHHKVIIIDAETVITGSFNFTVSADTINDENVLFIHSAEVAALFEDEFQRIYKAGVILQPSSVDCGK